MVATMVALAVHFLMPEQFFVRFGSLLGLAADTSLQARLEQWEPVYPLVRESPLFGWGPAKASMTTLVENEYLFMLRRYGVVGLGLFLILLARLWHTGRRLAAHHRNTAEGAVGTALEGSVLGFFIYMTTLFLFHELQVSGLLWSLGGLAVGLERRGRGLSA
jgi:O-antigen ligase